MTSPESKNFLDQLSRSAKANEAATADNCRFDERVAEERWKRFEDRLVDPKNPNLPDWNEANALNYQNTVTVPSTSVPDSFLDISNPAILKSIATNRSVVRLEDLRRFFEKANLDFKTLQDLLDSKDADEKARLETKIEIWNQHRDGRPSFAAFYDEVKIEADHDDWQHQLRDRLGLGHYLHPSSKSADIPVALMSYSLDEVLASAKKRGVQNPFSLPTVLDGGMHEYFFPVPQSHPYGATLHLTPDFSDTLTAELLHYRIDYQPKHLWKIAWIKRPHNVQDQPLREARDLHLLALQEACNRPDFGEAMEGRL